MPPITAGGAATITGGAQIASSAINAMAQSNLNKRQQRWNEKTMALQRQQSLSDWTMQNEYNSPANQMKRFKEAGLNPHLIYGSANNNTATVRSTDTKQWNPTAPRVDINAGQVMSSYFDTKMKQAQTNNLEQQNTNLALQAMLTAAQTEKTNSETDTNKYNLKFKNLTQEWSMQALEQSVRKAGLDIKTGEANLQNQLTTNETQKAIQANTIKSASLAVMQQRLQQSKTIAETDQIKENIKKIQQNQRLDAFEESLNKIGLTRSDPRWMRVVNEIVTNPESVTDTIQKAIKKFFNN